MLQETGKMLVLASASPRRRELLLQAGFVFEVRVADVDETPRPKEEAVRLAVRLAQAKAAAAASPGSVALGADTVVVAPDGELLAKPSDDADAARMLRLLAGRTHQVVTGICAMAGNHQESAAALTWVRFQTLSDEEITAYINTGEPRGKAGAYAIQGRAARWIPWIQGDYSNVVGLPLALTCDLLAGFGISPRN